MISLYMVKNRIQPLGNSARWISLWDESTTISEPTMLTHFLVISTRIWGLTILSPIHHSISQIGEGKTWLMMWDGNMELPQLAMRTMRGSNTSYIISILRLEPLDSLWRMGVCHRIHRVSEISERGSSKMVWSTVWSLFLRSYSIVRWSRVVSGSYRRTRQIEKIRSYLSMLVIWERWSQEKIEHSRVKI